MRVAALERVCMKVARMHLRVRAHDAWVREHVRICGVYARSVCAYAVYVCGYIHTHKDIYT